MLDRVALLLAVASAAAIVTGAAPSISGPASPTSEAQALPSTKGDRLSSRVPATIRSSVSSLMRTGSDGQLSVKMKDARGHVLYSSDPLSGVTVAARNADYAELPVPAAAPVAVPAIAATTRAGKIPVGCERAVSVLTQSTAARTLGRCIT